MNFWQFRAFNLYFTDQNGFLGAAVCDFPDFAFVKSVKHGKSGKPRKTTKVTNTNKTDAVSSDIVTPSAHKSKSVLIKK